LFVREISWETLNQIAPNSQGRRVWSATFKVKVKCQRLKEPETKKRHFSAFLAACLRFMFGKTSLALVFSLFLSIASSLPSAQQQS